MKRVFTLIFVSVLALFLLPTVSFAQSQQPIYTEAKIIQMTADQKTVSAQVEVTQGNLKGKQFEVSLFDPAQVKKQNIHVGDPVMISYQKDPTTGKDIVYITDHVRRQSLLILFVLFIIVVCVIGRLKGAFSFLAMLFSFFIIAQMIIPNIIAGTDPVVISLLGSLFIIPATFYISHGFNKQTTIAVISTFIALVFTGLLAYAFVELTKLTGFASEEATYIQAFHGDSINIKSLLLAGIIIGAMGVLDDITISQTSIVEKLHHANPKFSFGELFQHGMDVGRDHIASLVNTLILVYAGASLPLFLLFYNSTLSYSQVINQEIIATEIVRTLVSSIGIIAAVPITTFLAAMVVKKK